MRPLSERLISNIDDAVWGMSKLVLESMVVCLMRIGEALPTKLLPKKLNREDIRFVYKGGKLFETVVRVYPLKQSARARKAGKKIPIAIPASAGPYLMAAELLWLMVAAGPTVGWKSGFFLVVAPI